VGGFGREIRKFLFELGDTARVLNFFFKTGHHPCLNSRYGLKLTLKLAGRIS
jgi:hypothetical protein